MLQEPVSRVQITKQGQHKGWTKTHHTPQTFPPKRGMVSPKIIFSGSHRSKALFSIKPLTHCNVNLLLILEKLYF